MRGRHKDIFGSPVRPYSGQFQFRVQDQSELNSATASLGELLPAAELRLSKLIRPLPLPLPSLFVGNTEDEASFNAQGNLNGCLIKTTIVGEAVIGTIVRRKSISRLDLLRPFSRLGLSPGSRVSSVVR